MSPKNSISLQKSIRMSPKNFFKLYKISNLSLLNLYKILNSKVHLKKTFSFKNLTQFPLKITHDHKNFIHFNHKENFPSTPKGTLSMSHIKFQTTNFFAPNVSIPSLKFSHELVFNFTSMNF